MGRIPVNTSELIEKLSILQDVHGDLPVTVWADHGQSSEEAWSVCIQYRDLEGDVISDEDYQELDEEEKEDYSLVVEVAG